jgi:glycosyltransferase involved in cell wall biosynthesis
MNVLMINKFYFLKGGTERYYFNLSKLLEEKGHKVIPFAMKSQRNFSSEFERYFVSEVVTRPSWNLWQDLKTVGRFFWSWEAQRKIKKLIKEVGPIDVAHIHNIYHQISPSILSVLKKQGIPIVMTVHDYKLISPNYNLYLRGKIYDKICGNNFARCVPDRCVGNSFFKSIICSLEMWFHHRVLNIYKKNIDLFLAPSKFVTEKLIAAGYDKNKIRVIPHFVESSYLCHPRESEDPGYPLLNKEGRGEVNSPIGASGFRLTGRNDKHGNHEKYFLYFGRVSAEKGIDILIETAKEIPDAKFKIAGEGPEFKNYVLRIMNYGLKNIQMLGHKNSDELQNLIQSAYLIIVPSLAPETFGLSALEAMALGKCVVASEVGALPELVDHNFLFTAGNVFELVELIKKLINDINAVIENGEENRKKVEQLYDRESHYTKILGMYGGLK